jgi:hypothetical protein
MDKQPTTATILAFEDTRIIRDKQGMSTKDAMWFIARVRRSARGAIKTIQELRDRANKYRRKARVLKSLQSPFNNSRVTVLEGAADEIVAMIKSFNESLIKMGISLRDFAPMIDRATTMQQRCEILGVNVADRVGLVDDGFLHLVYSHRLEDSAERRGSEYNDGPLYYLLELAMIEFITNTHEGQKLSGEIFDELFASSAASRAAREAKPTLHLVAQGEVVA